MATPQMCLTSHASCIQQHPTVATSGRHMQYPYHSKSRKRTRQPFPLSIYHLCSHTRSATMLNHTRPDSPCTYPTYMLYGRTWIAHTSHLTHTNSASPLPSIDIRLHHPQLTVSFTSSKLSANYRYILNVSTMDVLFATDPTRSRYAI